MSHMVIYRGADGKPGYHQTDDIHEAIGFVEQMRNDEGVEHARIFRLEEVTFEYRPYYRVEIAGAGSIPTMLGEPQAPQLAEPDPAATLNTATLNMATPPPPTENAETIDLVEEMVDGGEQQPVEAPPVKAEAASGKKGLFGR